MKNVIFAIFALVFIVACQPRANNESDNTSTENNPKGSYGKVITIDQSIPSSALISTLGDQENMQIKLNGEIIASCQHSGCWMDMQLDSLNVLNITFKDGDFVVPLDSKGKMAVIEGIASQEIIPIETLKNWAKEEGKTEAEIEAIKDPKTKYNFVASGVFIED
jgi:uncharacterized protein DUF4920